MCSKMAAKLINSSDESSMGSAVYFSRRVFTENLKQKHTQTKELETSFYFQKFDFTYVQGLNFHLVVLHKQMKCSRVLYQQTNVLLYLNRATIAGRRVFFFFGNHAILSY